MFLNSILVLDIAPEERLTRLPISAWKLLEIFFFWGGKGDVLWMVKFGAERELSREVMPSVGK